MGSVLHVQEKEKVTAFDRVHTNSIAASRLYQTKIDCSVGFIGSFCAAQVVMVESLFLTDVPTNWSITKTEGNASFVKPDVV